MMDQLYCPTCHAKLQVDTESENLSWLSCNSCSEITPVVYGFPLFTESVVKQSDIDPQHLSFLSNCFNPHNEQYLDYIEQKKQRGIFEVYAAMQPFNESSQAFYPLLDELKSTLKPNDVIIDTWARTGWHCLLLAALFPKQQVIAIWEGNTSVLGYAGYGYWFSQEKRPKNLDILFVKPSQNLPLKTDSVQLVFAHDVIHRYEFPAYPKELLRVAKPQAVLLMPHIHLDNSQPKPYFERGGVLRHGCFYQEKINALLDSFTNALPNEPTEETRRSYLTLSEKELFNHTNNSVLNDASAGMHYNGFGLICPTSWLDKKFSNDFAYYSHTQAHVQNQAQQRFLINPLLTLNPFTGDILFRPDTLEGNLDYYLNRHPCYQERLKSTMDIKISPEGIRLYIILEPGQALQETAKNLGWTLPYAQQIANQLLATTLITNLPDSPQAIALQNFHSNNQPLFHASFIQFWKQLLTTQPDLTILELEGEEINVSETHELIMAYAKYYKSLIKDNNYQQIVIPLIADQSKLKLLIMAALWLGYQEIKFDSDSKKIQSQDNQFWSIIEDYMGDEIGAGAGDDRKVFNTDRNLWYRSLFLFK